MCPHVALYKWCHPSAIICGEGFGLPPGGVEPETIVALTNGDGGPAM